MLLVAGCGAQSERELQQWMADTRAATPVGVPPVPAPKTFSPEPYGTREQVEPFDSQKVIASLARQQQARVGAGGIRPDLNRRREPLEAFTLDQLRMVGMMNRDGTRVALIQAQGQTHLVRVGNHLGQNFGRVIKISETEVELQEIVQDAAGDWVERPTRLELQEARGNRR